jgi:transposase
VLNLLRQQALPRLRLDRWGASAGLSCGRAKRRAGIVLASLQGRSAGEIAMMFAATENYVREVIHAFNAQGFAALDLKWSGGRPAKFDPAARDLICRIVRATPSALGNRSPRGA